ncbi:MAG: hypothetical protein PUP93_07650 [Rhizonema sp. NSF051]|nr:hypothetical protein [Rhizonema sp. NSF051]
MPAIYVNVKVTREVHIAGQKNGLASEIGMSDRILSYSIFVHEKAILRFITHFLLPLNIKGQ